TPARHRQFASSPVRIAFAAATTKSWLVLFARAVRPTERSARRPARQQPVYVYVGDLGHRVATSRPPAKECQRIFPRASCNSSALWTIRLHPFALSLSTPLRLTLEVPPRSSLRLSPFDLGLPMTEQERTRLLETAHRHLDALTAILDRLASLGAEAEL